MRACIKDLIATKLLDIAEFIDNQLPDDADSRKISNDLKLIVINDLSGSFEYPEEKQAALEAAMWEE